MMCDYDLDYLKNDPAIKRVVNLIEDLDSELRRSFDQEVLDVQNSLVDDHRQLVLDSKNGYCLSDQDIEKIIDQLILPF